MIRVGWKKGVSAYYAALRVLVMALAFISGAAVLAMMVLICADVAARAFGRPVTGSYDVVQMLGLVAIAGALPYTTAVKGHVAVEYFFNKLPRAGRTLVDSLMRLLMIALFALLSEQSVHYAWRLQASGEVSATLQWPVFWMPLVVAFCSGASALVVLHNLFHPGKVMIKP